MNDREISSAADLGQLLVATAMLEKAQLLSKEQTEEIRQRIIQMSTQTATLIANIDLTRDYFSKPVSLLNRGIPKWDNKMQKIFSKWEVQTIGELSAKTLQELNDQPGCGETTARMIRIQLYKIAGVLLGGDNETEVKQLLADELARAARRRSRLDAELAEQGWKGPSGMEEEQSA